MKASVLLCRLVIASIPFLSVPADAVVINGYDLNEATDIITDPTGSLQWLQWDLTTGQSVADATTAFGSDGWTLASFSQMLVLLDDFFDIAGFSDNEDLDQNVLKLWTPDETGPHQDFISLFGDTFAVNNVSTSTIPTDPTTYSYAIFGEDSDGDLTLNSTRIFDDREFVHGAKDSHKVRIQPDGFITATHSSDYIGVALVRSVTPVPTPPAFILFACGLAGLWLGKRRVVQAQA